MIWKPQAALICTFIWFSAMINAGRGASHINTFLAGLEIPTKSTQYDWIRSINVKISTKQDISPAAQKLTGITYDNSNGSMMYCGKTVTSHITCHSWEFHEVVGTYETCCACCSQLPCFWCWPNCPSGLKMWTHESVQRCCDGFRRYASLLQEKPRVLKL